VQKEIGKYGARERRKITILAAASESASVPLGAVWKRILELQAHNKKPNLQGARRICCLLFISHTTCEWYKLISRSRRREHYVVRRGEKNLPSNIMRLWISRRKILGARVWKKTLLYIGKWSVGVEMKRRLAEFPCNLKRTLKLRVLNFDSGGSHQETRAAQLVGGAVLLCEGRVWRFEDLICSRWHCFTKASQGIRDWRRAIVVWEFTEHKSKSTPRRRLRAIVKCTNLGKLCHESSTRMFLTFYAVNKFNS